MREWVSDHYHKTKPPLEPRECAADGCGKVFTPVRARQATCGARRCQREYRRAKNREYNATYAAKKRSAEQRERLAEMMAESERKRREQHAA